LVIEARLGKRRTPSRDKSLTLEGEDLTGKEFSGRKLVALSVVDSRLVRCRFERMIVESVCFGAGLMPSEYTQCSFDGSKFAGTHWGRARFVECSFRDVRLKGFFGFDAEFIDCVFTGRAESMVFHGSPHDGLEDVQALVEGVAELLDPVERAALKARVDRASRTTGQDSLDRSLNEFRGNDFRDMELVDVDFRRGIDLGKQLLPDDDDYVLVADARAAIVGARERVRFWDDTRAREYALAVLRDLMQNVEDGQQQFLLRASEWGKDDAQRTLFHLLTMPH
jgi:uncharacterized protein YjbI with pentapeptide repeats